MEHIEQIFAALKAETPRLRHTDARTRADKLKRLWLAIAKRKEDLFAASAKERGTHDLDVAAELMMVKAEIDFVAKHLPKWIKPQRVKNSMATMGKRCEIRYQSKGVVLNMAAFNAPTAESFVPLIASVAAGNATLIKPSELAPFSAQIIEEIIKDVFPSTEAAVVQGGVEEAQALLKLPFDHIYYTGGMSVGRIVMRAAAENFASITLEMGGKSPVIVDETADLANAATKIAWGRVMNAGQVCVAPDYALVQDSVKEDFTALLSEKIKELYDSEGTGIQNSPYMPRMINQHHTQRVKAMIEDAVEKGATLAFGGGSDVADNYIEPTLLTNVSDDMQVLQDEVFGPVMAIVGWSARQDVLDAVAKRPNPLALYIYSTDKEATEFFIENTSSGSAVVNNNCIQSGTNPRLPFGGVGRSGMGRIGGFEGFKELSNARSVVHSPLGFRDILMQLPPYSARYTKLIMNALK